MPANPVQEAIRLAARRRAWLGSAVLVALLAGCSGESVFVDTAANAADSQSEVGGVASNEGAVAVDDGVFFDDSVVHDIEVSFDEDVYDEMIAVFSSTGDKDWIEATVTIDGTTFSNVGLRLKGNSSLMGLQSGAFGGRGGTASAEAPNSLPWLIRLDKYVDGQNVGGITEFAVRSNNTDTSLNEAVALALLALSGQATERSIATSFVVNGSDAALRLVVEVPNDEWDDSNFATDGVLYKAESTGDYSYRGDDPDAYDEVFDQESNTDEENLEPLMAFLDFINNSDDATFAAELGDHLDVEAFARYLALQELVNNFDDIDGPGNNSYLRFDEETGLMTVISWDLNLAFGVTNGGGAVPDLGARDGVTRDGVAPNGFPGGGRGAGGFGGQDNILVQRYQANGEFAALYETTLDDLRMQLYGSGAAEGVLADWVALLKGQAGELVDAATVDREAAAIAAQFTTN